MAEKRLKRFDVSTFICADKDDLSFWKSTLQCTDTKNAHVRVNIETEEEFLAFRKADETEAKVHFTVERSNNINIENEDLNVNHNDLNNITLDIRKIDYGHNTTFAEIEGLGMNDQIDLDELNF